MDEENTECYIVERKESTREAPLVDLTEEANVEILVNIRCSFSMMRLEQPCLPTNCESRHYWSALSMNSLYHHFEMAKKRNHKLRCPICNHVLPDASVFRHSLLNLVLSAYEGAVSRGAVLEKDYSSDVLMVRKECGDQATISLVPRTKEVQSFVLLRSVSIDPNRTLIYQSLPTPLPSITKQVVDASVAVARKPEAPQVQRAPPLVSPLAPLLARPLYPICSPFDEEEEVEVPSSRYPIKRRSKEDEDWFDRAFDAMADRRKRRRKLMNENLKRLRSMRRTLLRFEEKGARLVNAVEDVRSGVVAISEAGGAESAEERERQLKANNNVNAHLLWHFCKRLLRDFDERVSSCGVDLDEVVSKTNGRKPCEKKKQKQKTANPRDKKFQLASLRDSEGNRCAIEAKKLQRSLANIRNNLKKCSNLSKEGSSKGFGEESSDITKRKAFSKVNATFWDDALECLSRTFTE